MRGTNLTHGTTENTIGILYFTEQQRTRIHVQVRQKEPSNEVPNHHPKKRNFLNIHPIINTPDNKTEQPPTEKKNSTTKHSTVTPKQHENEEMSVEIPHQNTKNQNQKRNTRR